MIKMEKLFDTHIHSVASPDGDSTAEEIIQIASTKGLGIIFTEHADYDETCKPIFCVDFDKYPKEYIKHKSKNVLLGLELNLITECKDINKMHSQNPDFDYILGSVHCTNGFDLGADTKRTANYFYEYGDKFYEMHLIYVLEMIKQADYFDSFGHIDYISRYSVLEEKNALYDKFANIYDEILKTLINRGQLLELNTSRLKEKGASSNLTKIFTRYKELGGEYITLGSDAHIADDIGKNFDIALKLANNIGVKPAYFANRQKNAH